MNETIGERIKILMRHYGLNKNSLTVKLGMSSNSVIGRIVNDPDRAPSFEILKEILIKHPMVNARWFVTGEGDMFSREVMSIQKGEISYFKLMAGSEFPDIDGKATAVLIVNGFTDCEYAFDVFGDSMAPRFRSGDIVLCAGVDKPIQLGEPYFIVSQGIPHVRTVKGVNDNSYKLSAENNRFDDYELRKEDVEFIFPVKGVIRREVY